MKRRESGCDRQGRRSSLEVSTSASQAIHSAGPPPTTATAHRVGSTPTPVASLTPGTLVLVGPVVHRQIMAYQVIPAQRPHPLDHRYWLPHRVRRDRSPQPHVQTRHRTQPQPLAPTRNVEGAASKPDRLSSRSGHVSPVPLPTTGRSPTYPRQPRREVGRRRSQRMSSPTSELSPACEGIATGFASDDPLAGVE